MSGTSCARTPPGCASACTSGPIFWPLVPAGTALWRLAFTLLWVFCQSCQRSHADRAFGIFAEAETSDRSFEQIEHGLKYPVEIVLFFFGLLNAGVEFSSIGEATWLVLAGLIVGKPLGVLLFGWIAARPMGLGLPEGMRVVDLFVIGCVAAIGFTVSLFIATVAFDAGPVQEAAKMGALFSFIAAVISFAAGAITRVQKQPG